MLDSLMNFMMNWIGRFFDWWEDITGFGYSAHSGIGFNWTIISFMIMLIGLVIIASLSGIIP